MIPASIVFDADFKNTLAFNGEKKTLSQPAWKKFS
jgi:hypothetical protein